MHTTSQRRKQIEAANIRVVAQGTLISLNKINGDESFIVPTYDMSRIEIQSENKSDIDFNYDLYVKIITSCEGRDIVNELKNHKTNDIVNEFLKIKGDEITEVLPIQEIVSNERKNFKRLLKELIECPIEGKTLKVNNCIPLKSIGITKKQIWKRFLEAGLVEKFSKL